MNEKTRKLTEMNENETIFIFKNEKQNYMYF